MIKKIVQIVGSSFEYQGEKSPCLEIEVPEHQILVVNNQHSNFRIKCLCGNLWITHRNDPDDHILKKNQVYSILNGRKVVIEGIPSAKLCLTMQ
jgi:hypothetical protein